MDPETPAERGGDRRRQPGGASARTSNGSWVPGKLNSAWGMKGGNGQGVDNDMSGKVLGEAILSGSTRLPASTSTTTDSGKTPKYPGAENDPRLSRARGHGQRRRISRRGSTILPIPLSGLKLRQLRVTKPRQKRCHGFERSVLRVAAATMHNDLSDDEKMLAQGGHNIPIHPAQVPSEGMILKRLRATAPCETRLVSGEVHEADGSSNDPSVNPDPGA